MWPLLLATAAAVGGTYLITRGKRDSTNAINPNLSQQAPAQAPLNPAGLATQPLNFIADYLPSNPFAQSIRPPSMAFPGFYSDEWRPFSEANPLNGKGGKVIGTSNPSTISAQPQASPKSSSCGCGGNCCDNKCKGNNTRFPDGKGGCMAFTPGSYAASIPDSTWEDVMTKLNTSGAGSPFDYAQQVIFNAQEHAGLVPVGPAYQYEGLTQY